MNVSRTSLLVVLLVAGCANTPAPSPVPSKVAIATPTPTPEPTVETPTAHIQAALVRLVNLTTDADIEAWIDTENDWADQQPMSETVRLYILALIPALADVAFEKDLRETVTQLMDDIRDIPGID